MVYLGLREDFIVSKFDGRFRQRLDPSEHLSLMRASSISEIDFYGIVAYNGFDDLIDYYTEMSAMGDTGRFQHSNGRIVGENTDVGRIQNITVPLCVVHARK